MIHPVEQRTTGGPELERDLIRSEHEALRACTERLEVVLARLAQSRGEPAGASEVQRLLDEFRRRLFDHLVTEEQSGVFERAAAAEPRFERRVRRLQSEHGELRARVEALARDLVAESTRTGWARGHADFVVFRRVLHVHEQAENDVLHGAYLEDIGGRG